MEQHKGVKHAQKRVKKSSSLKNTKKQIIHEKYCKLASMDKYAGNKQRCCIKEQ